MKYRFAVERHDYSDYASGRVFYSLPGQPAFPVRLASEIFQRCWEYRQSAEPCVIYDPCCGGAYHLSVLGYWHGRQMEEIVVSDLNTAVLPLAQRNLNLLTASGLAERIAELQQLYATYQKASHAAALASAARLQERQQRYLGEHVIPTHLFAANVMDKAAIMAGVNDRSIDIVISDIPYGWLTDWHTDDVNKSPAWQMLETLRFVLSPAAVVAIAADKQQKVAHEGYERLDKFQVGKRRVWIGRLL
jgi:hypothetical protein